MLGGVGHMIDSGCHSLGPVSLWAFCPCLWASVEELVFTGMAQHTPCLLCAAGPPALPARGVDGTPGSHQGPSSVLRQAGLLEGLLVHFPDPG